MTSPALLVLLLAVAQAAAPRVGADLRAGMQLVYGSDMGEQPPWTVERIEAGSRLMEGADCAVVQIRRQPGPAAAPVAELCVENSLLKTRNAAGEWVIQRPVAPRMEVSLTRPNGDTVRIVTGEVEEVTIGARRIPAVLTTMTTIDAAGRPRQRLTERYALSLTTATSGRFETPDASAPSGWRTTQVFELRTITTR
jgi:hypothetical protein